MTTRRGAITTSFARRSRGMPLSHFPRMSAMTFIARILPRVLRARRGRSPQRDRRSASARSTRPLGNLPAVSTSHFAGAVEFSRQNRTERQGSFVSSSEAPIASCWGSSSLTVAAPPAEPRPGTSVPPAPVRCGRGGRRVSNMNARGRRAHRARERDAPAYFEAPP